MNVILNFKYQYFSFYDLLSCFIVHKKNIKNTFNGVHVWNRRISNCQN